MFNLTEITNKELNVKTDVPNENIFNTEKGQVPVSTVENHWMRLSREGFLVTGYLDAKAFNIGELYYDLIRADLGRRMYLSQLAITPTVDARITIRIINTNHSRQFQPQNTMPNEIIMKYTARANEQLLIKFEGDFWFQDMSTLQINCKPLDGTTSGIFYANAHGIEVTVPHV